MAIKANISVMFGLVLFLVCLGIREAASKTVMDQVTNLFNDWDGSYTAPSAAAIQKRRAPPATMMDEVTQLFNDWDGSYIAPY